MLKDSKNNYESTNKMSLEFDIQRYLDVNLTSSFDDNYYFDIKDAIPITLNVASFFLLIQIVNIIFITFLDYL